MMRLAPFGLLLLAAGLGGACGDASSSDLLGGAAGAGAGAGSAGTAPDGGSAGNGNGAPGTAGGGGGSTTPGAGGGPGATGDDAGSSPPGSPPAAPNGAGIPCDVAAMLAAKCVTCHANPPVNGSLHALVTLADLMATSIEDPTKNEAQLSLARMQNAASPMPPASVGSPATASDIQALQTWIDGGYVGSCGDASAPPPPPDVFTGAPGFVSALGDSTHHPGQDCMGGCHNHGFTFAGTLTNGSGLGVAGAEVRLVDANGTAISVHTGSNGSFHTTKAFVGPAHVGARDATTKALMVTALQPANGGCNGCHATGGTTPPMHLP